MPPSSRSYDRNPNSNQRGGGRHHLPFERPPAPGGFQPTMGMGGFQSGPVPGHKRGRPLSPDGNDGASFAKLFVGSVPKTATEEDVRPLFEEHGDVIEVALLKDKRTGQQQGCCFIKYATPEEADRAIGALHNKYTLPGGTGPIQVRFADGERERLGAVEHKLFVGSLNKQATEKEIEEVFSPYGRVEDVYIMRDEVKQSRGCGFVKFSHREMAAAAIAALSGVYVMRGCEQPLTVRFADPKRPRGGESRGAPASGGPGYGSRSQAFPGARPPPYLGEPMGGPAPPNAWHLMSPQSAGPSPQVNTHGSGSHLTDTGSVAPVPSTMGGSLGAHGGPMNGSLMGFSLPPPSFQKNSDPTLSQAPSVGQQILPMQKPLQSPQRMLPPPFQPVHSQQMPVSYSQKETPPISVQQAGQLQHPSSTSQPFLTQMPSQNLFALSEQVPRSQSQVQHTAASAVPLNYQRQGLSVPGSQQQLLQPLQQPPTQLAQVLSQQTQALQASFQSSQQAFSQLQQQLHLIQQSSQNPSQNQATQSQAPKQLSPWPGAVPVTGASTPAAPAAVVTSAASAASGSANMQMPAPQTCNWTEHTSPGGYKYYYNSITAESRWEKPEEMTLFEQQQQQQQLQPLQQQLQPLQQQPQPLQQQQKHSVQLQPYSHPQVVSSQQVSQTQPVQLQTQIHNQQQFQLQRSLLPSSDLGYVQPQQGPQQAPNFGTDPAHYQQVPQFQAAQEWVWKNKPAGA